MPERGPVIPGSFKSTITLGKRFVPAPTPSQAATNVMLRNYAPWGPFFVDEPPTGVGPAGRVMGTLPFVGGGIQALLSGIEAGKKQGQMVEVPPKQGWFRNFLQTLGNIAAFVPAINPAVSAAKIGIGAASGLAGVTSPSTSWGQTAAGLAGLAGRAATSGRRTDRNFFDTMLQGQGSVPSESSGAYRPTPAPYGRYPSENPFTDVWTGFTPAWAGGPSTWNQPKSTWEGTPWYLPPEQRPAPWSPYGVPSSQEPLEFGAPT